MKICDQCGQLVAEEVSVCPNCGNQIGEGRKYIDDYRIAEVIHESYSSILCRAYKEGAEEPVMVRIFTPNAHVDEKIAHRLKKELEVIQELPEEYFVRHYEIKRSSEGLWYRISEWVDAEKWGTLLGSGIFQDYRIAFDFFSRLASILEGLHQIGHIIPHLILDDILVIKEKDGSLGVKVDYKISRFLDPQMDRPGPMLKKLLKFHPDIINERPLDIRSDIWSLGKIFVELLSGDPDISDFSGKVDQIALPAEVRALIRVMLSEDPETRPQSMAEVARVLGQVKDKEIKNAKMEQKDSAPVPVKRVKGIKQLINLLAIALVLVTILGGFAWYYLGVSKKDAEKIFLEFADKYANSIAFVMVDYWLKTADDVIFYHNRTEGTAFLVDKSGYLLTNRHVACPWLEDEGLFLALSRYDPQEKSPSLGYRMFLWFEGERAFNRLPELPYGSSVEDIYHVESAFSTEGEPGVIISGVARSPTKTYQTVKSPLKDDFAVLKIHAVPKGLKPLPLDVAMDINTIKKLSPVITLGFPLGSSTQAATINVSVTRGHVRRKFEDMFQVDTSIYKGNSGGPVVDINGKVIGIATGVAVGWATSPIPVATMLSDIGMVLPIKKIVPFLQDLKAGKAKWNGTLDLSLYDTLKKIRECALAGQWTKAKELADKQAKRGLNPEMVTAAAVMHFCSGDNRGAKSLFEQKLSIDKEDNMARFMLYVIDWLEGKTYMIPHRKVLLELDWRSLDEFFGYMVGVNEGKIDEKKEINGAYDERERSWLYFIFGLKRATQRDLLGAENFFKEAILAADIDEWLLFFALSRLEGIQQQIIASLGNYDKEAYKNEIELFSRKIEDDYTIKKEHKERIKRLNAQLEQEAVLPRDKIALLSHMLELNYRKGDTLVRLAYFSAMEGLWEQAIEYAQKYLNIDGRESKGRLKLGLLDAQIYNVIGQKDRAQTSLVNFYKRIKDPWYHSISDCLLSNITEKSLLKKVGEIPEKLLTAQTSLGFQAEGSGEKEKAIKHYKEALGSYLDDWIEYEFAKERIKKLRGL